MKYLIIAEKPSVAADLSRALAKKLGKFEKRGKSRDTHHFHNENAAITSAVGHLVELKMPTGPNGKNLPWNFSVLPAIPSTFELEPIEQSADRLRHLLTLAKRKDIDIIVNACDAGREGELIFQYIMEIGKIQKPVKRLWMQSMTSGAIQEAWDGLREGAEMTHLADAAKCRSESDWLVGLNSTRALTCFRSRHGGFNLTAAGRVQTPTLAILAEREREIKAFKPENYWEVHADFEVSGGIYPGRWFNPKFKKDPQQPHGRAERIWDEAQAKVIEARCADKSGIVTEKKKPLKQIAPQLYDLTTLQREAPFTAKNTLGIAQALYERHKMVTYPRTDSRYLAEDYVSKVHETTQELANSRHPVAQWAAKSIESGQIRLNKRIFNNAKISDHFAIIPTGRIVKLSEQEAKVYDMIVKRFIAVFFPQAEFEVTKRITTIDHGAEQDTFLTQGKTLINPGWLAVYGRTDGVAVGKDGLVAVQKGESAQIPTAPVASAVEGEEPRKPIRVEDKETKPSARFTESTLLAAMEGAGKLVEDDDLREAMAERGLGTPATRAAVIEGLIRQQYIAREGRELHVTGKGLRLIELCEEMEIKALASPSMTGEWEAKLNRMQRGEIQREAFMEEIADFTEEMVAKAKNYMDAAVNHVFPDLETSCPACYAPRLKQTDATFECCDPGCKFKISKYIAGRKLEEDEAIKLFDEKELPEMEGFRSRFNKPFKAGLKLSQTGSKLAKWKTEFVFHKNIEPDEDLSDHRMIKDLTLKNGTAAQLYATRKAYYVPLLKTKETPEGFRLGKIILQKELELPEVEALFTQGKTPLLDDFISKRTKRPFKAHLTLNFETGKIGFEFENPTNTAVRKK